MTALPFPNPRFLARDPDTDTPLVGGKVYFYAAGTTTPQDTWADYDQSATNPNPVILEADGGFNIYGNGSYRIIVKRADDTIVSEIDDVLIGNAASGGGSGGSINGGEVVTTVDYNVTFADSGKILIANRPNAITFAFAAASDLGPNFSIIIKNIGIGLLTLNPAGAETIDGAPLAYVAPGRSVLLTGNGSTFRSHFLTKGGAINPADIGAMGFIGSETAFNAALGSAADDYMLLQAIINALSTMGGGVMEISRWYKCNSPLIVPYGVSIKGENKFSCGIVKDSVTTSTVTYYGSAANPQVTIYPGNLPTACNAVLILGTAFASGRWVGELSGFTVGGTYSSPGNWESQKVEFGIISIGDLSDFVIGDLNVNNFQYGVLLPTPFVGTIRDIRATACLAGFGIGNATTLTMHSNYASDCRDYGYAFRSTKYSNIFANACDLLNDQTRFPTRSRECSAYIFDSCIGVVAEGNGQEQTWGNSLLLNTLRYCRISFNQNIQLGSDYSGTAEIAFLKIVGAMVGCEVYGNNSYEQKAGGFIQGSANAAKHHNIYIDPAAAASLNGSSIYNNVVRDVFGGLDTEGGWGNNVGQSAMVVSKDRLIVGMNRDSATLVHRALIRGLGSSSATFALGVQNLSGSSLLELRDDGAVLAQGVYDTTSGSGANVVVGSTGTLARSTSALKYKDVVGPMSDDTVAKVMQMAAFVYTAKGDDSGREFIGMAAEDFHDAGLHWFVHYGANGEPEGLMYERVVSAILQWGRSIEARLEALESKE